MGDNNRCSKYNGTSTAWGYDGIKCESINCIEVQKTSHTYPGWLDADWREYQCASKIKSLFLKKDIYKTKNFKKIWYYDENYIKIIENDQP